VLFNPAVVRNFPDCGSEVPDWLQAARARAKDNQGLETYFDRDRLLADIGQR
jgi:hypothetical protein